MADSNTSPASGVGANAEVPAKRPQRNVLSLLTNIGELRDALLVGAGTVYILGYMTWSISAFYHGLGLLPAVEAQYFMAGIVPAIILGGVLLLLFNVVVINTVFQRLFGPEKAVLDGTFRFLAFAFWGIFAGVSAVYCMDLLLQAEWLVVKEQVDSMLAQFGEERPALYATVLLVTMFFMLSAPYLVMKSNAASEFASDSGPAIAWWRPRALYYRYQGTAQLIYLTVGLGAVGLLAYGKYFENLPQEFGGIGRRCAYLDINSDKLSRASLAMLAESSTFSAVRTSTSGTAATVHTVEQAAAHSELGLRHNSAAAREAGSFKVVRSRKVDVIFRGSSVILVEVDEIRHEIKPAAVGMITWCDG